MVNWQHNTWLRPSHLSLLRATRRLGALWVADSASVRASTVARLGIPQERLLTWPLFKADPAAAPGVVWSPGHTVRIGSLGRLRPAKGYDVLIAALACLRSSGFTPAVPYSIEVVGEGTGRAKLEKQAQACGVDISFPGYRHDVGAFLAGLHLYVQPSRREGLCIAAHEAMQAGLPLIVSDTGEMADSVGRGADVGGFTVRPDDAENLADALSKMLANPGGLAAIGGAARTRLLARFGPDAFDAAGTAVMTRISAMLSGQPL